MSSVEDRSDVKLIRTDTTLDLSRKAEKGMYLIAEPSLLILQGIAFLHGPYGIILGSIMTLLLS
jgi:hypothetical protein